VKTLLSHVDDAIKGQRLPWKRSGGSVEVELWGRRRQRVHLERRGDRYVFWSRVVGPKIVTRTDREWRELAYRSWRKNGFKELVGFSFDRRDCLIGVIQQLAATLDREELVLYIDTLARECDRFEYKLTGGDEG
jgi:hypothetical protein